MAKSGRVRKERVFSRFADELCVLQHENRPYLNAEVAFESITTGLLPAHF